MGRKKKEIEVIPMEITPNCARCKWHLYSEHLLYFWNKTSYSICTACGMIHPSKAYGSENCKKNYEKKEGVE